MGLIRFFSQDDGEVLMLSSNITPVMEAAELIFHTEGAFLLEDLPSVIARIEKVIENLSSHEVVPKDDDQEEDEDPEKRFKRAFFVQAKVRFYPLLDLLKNAAKHGNHVYWQTL